MSLISRRKGAHGYVVLVKLSKSISTLWPSNPRPKTNCTVRAKPAERWDNVLQGPRLRMCSVLSDSLRPVDGSPPGPSVPGILQAGMPERVAEIFPTQGWNRQLANDNLVLYGDSRLAVSLSGLLFYQFRIICFYKNLHLSFGLFFCSLPFSPVMQFLCIYSFIHSHLGTVNKAA